MRVAREKHGKGAFISSKSSRACASDGTRFYVHGRSSSRPGPIGDAGVACDAVSMTVAISNVNSNLKLWAS